MVSVGYHHECFIACMRASWQLCSAKYIDCMYSF